MWGYHQEKSNVIDMTDLRERYKDDVEIMGLVDIAKGLQAELAEYEKERASGIGN